jgi:hypothetical protein
MDAGNQMITGHATSLTSLSELDRRGAELEMLCDALTSCPVGDPITAPRPVLTSPQHGFVTTTIGSGARSGDV